MKVLIESHELMQDHDGKVERSDWIELREVASGYLLFFPVPSPRFVPLRSRSLRKAGEKQLNRWVIRTFSSVKSTNDSVKS